MSNIMNNQILDNSLQSDDSNTKIRYAGFWIRLGASLIDFVVYLPLIIVHIYNIYLLKSYVLEIIIVLILTIYKPLMEFKYGSTLGKMAVKVKVVTLDYGSINLTQSITRYIPWLIGQVISTYSLIILFQNPDFISTTNWIEVGNIQNEIIPMGINYISSIILIISCLFIAFTEKKQGLHDMIANTYCTYR